MRHQPLAFLLRPQNLEGFFGQSALMNKGAFLRKLIEQDKIKSVIFYGPSGTGKSTLAHIIANKTKARVKYLNAVIAKIDDIREAIKQAEAEPLRQTILFVDEIHRFTKVQQDGLLPFVEDGTVTLIGITTENPFFFLTKALISRSNVFEFKPLTEDDLKNILDRALLHVKDSFKIAINMDDKVRTVLLSQASGDARRLINILELLIDFDNQGTQDISVLDIEKVSQKKAISYDREDDKHYDTISAFIKSVRGSDPDAAIYWAAKMLEAGEPPEFILRRLVILAAEDIGNADPTALILANSAFEASRYIGMPEARIIMSQAITYCACAPKSNASYLAIDKALEDIRNNIVHEVPNHLRDSNFWNKTKLRHGTGYIYPHDSPYHYIKQEYLPSDKKYYEPGDLGFEKKMKERLKFLNTLKSENDNRK